MIGDELLEPLQAGPVRHEYCTRFTVSEGVALALLSAGLSIWSKGNHVMNLQTSLWRMVLGLSLVAIAAGPLVAQGGPPWAGRGGGAGRGAGAGGQGGGFGRGPAWARQDGNAVDTFVTDRDVFHFLLQNHEQIRREVKNTKTGVETLTESDNPQVAAKIQEHVAAMAKRVEQQRPIRMHDPLFVELFRHADKIHLEYKNTPNGVRVVETSDDPRVVALIQAHGSVVSLFVKNGFDEARKNHEVPGAQAATTAAEGRGPDVPVAAGPCAGCPLATAAQGPRAATVQCPAGANCPSNPQSAAGGACAGCPAAGTCPRSSAAQDPPLPPASEKPGTR
jgi:hypothetical protein